MSEHQIYRVGNHQPQNLYRGDTYIGVMFSVEDAAMIVAHLNANVAAMPVDQHPPFRDGQGDWWRWDGQTHGYSYNGTGALFRTIEEIKKVYGTWNEGCDD